MVLHDVVSHPDAIFVPLTPIPWKVSNIPWQIGMSLFVIYQIVVETRRRR